MRFRKLRIAWSVFWGVGCFCELPLSPGSRPLSATSRSMDARTKLRLYLMLLAAWKNVRLARLFFFLIFSWASWTNWKTALFSPQTYLGEADLTFFAFYREFILGWFSQHITEAVGFIATCQALIAISMLLKGWCLKAGGIGAILFLLAIAPFGVGSAFPCTVILAAGMYLILRGSGHTFLWMRNKYKLA